MMKVRLGSALGGSTELAMGLSTSVRMFTYATSAPSCSVKVDTSVTVFDRSPMTSLASSWYRFTPILCAHCTRYCSESVLRKETASTRPVASTRPHSW